jgi:hypothetical protein
MKQFTKNNHLPRITILGKLSCQNLIQFGEKTRSATKCNTETNQIKLRVNSDEFECEKKNLNRDLSSNQH